MCCCAEKRSPYQFFSAHLSGLLVAKNMRLLHKRETAFKNIAPLRLGLLSKVSFLQTSLPIRSDKPANDPYAELN